MRLMAKDKNFNDVSDLVEYVNSEIKKCMETKVAETIKELAQDSVQVNVLDVYEPKTYERRSDKGSMDSLKFSWDTNIDEKKGEVILEVGSSAKPVDRKFGDLGENIEEGYWKKNKPWNQPRPFVKPVQEHIEEAKVTERVLKDELDFFE